MYGSGEDQMIVRGLCEVQMRVKSQMCSELDIGGCETCVILFLQINFVSMQCHLSTVL